MLGRTNTGGGGSGGLNFQVIGGTTAPSNPKENMIWVNTSTKITSYIFSATQPTGSAGMVWISTGTSSKLEFNALKKNGIQVYPISAKQYISGAWVDKTAKSYQNGEWVEWFPGAWLYNGGSVNEELTGGWKTTKGYDIVFSFTNEGIKAKEANNDSSRDAAAYTNKKVDVTKYNWLIAEKVSVRGHVRGGAASLNYFTIGLTNQNTANTHTGFVAEKRISTEMTDTEVKINISGVSGSYYIGLQADVACGTVDKLYLTQ